MSAANVTTLQKMRKMDRGSGWNLWLYRRIIHDPQVRESSHPSPTDSKDIMVDDKFWQLKMLKSQGTWAFWSQGMQFRRELIND